MRYNENTGGVIKTFKLIFKIILLFILTVIVWAVAIYILGEVYKQNNNVSGGVAYSIVLYPWGIYFMNKSGGQKILGVILFTLAVLSNFLLIASPYDTNAEYASTRFFALPAIAAGIYLICRKTVASKILGILLLVATVLSFVLGLLFMIGNIDM